MYCDDAYLWKSSQHNPTCVHIKAQVAGANEPVINQDYNKLINGDPDKNKPGLTPEAAYEKMRNKYVYLQEKYLHQMCDGTYECNTHNDI